MYYYVPKRSLGTSKYTEMNKKNPPALLPPYKGGLEGDLKLFTLYVLPFGSAQGKLFKFSLLEPLRLHKGTLQSGRLS
jgi:hypothetical protein